LKSSFTHAYPNHRLPHSFPTRRSSDLDRRLRLNDRFCVNSDASKVCAPRDGNPQEVVGVRDRADITLGPHRRAVRGHGYRSLARDRKSTRLNSSHVSTSYAVFCLKKKI